MLYIAMSWLWIYKNSIEIKSFENPIIDANSWNSLDEVRQPIGWKIETYC